MGVLQGAPKLGASAVFNFPAHRLRDELAAVPLSAVNLSEQVRRQTHSHSFHSRHFILLV
jgi:hypothetical protein